MPIEYPIKKKDDLGRVVHIDWNGVERIANIYWNDTNQIKIKYRFCADDVSFDIYDKENNNTISYSSGKYAFKIKRFKQTASGELFFYLEKSLINRLRTIVKNNNKKVKQL